MGFRFRHLVLAAFAAGTAALPGCTGVVRRRVERKIERRLADLLGPAEEYRVRILDTRDAELVRGRARRVEIEGTRIFARQQFLLDSLRLTILGVEYAGGDQDFINVRRSDLEVEFTDKALNDYLMTYSPSGARYKPHVEFEPEQVMVGMTYPLLGKETSIHATGHFVIQEGRRLLFNTEKADVSFLNQPGFGERFVEGRLNPILDLSRIDFPARLESVQVFQGRVRAYGTAALHRQVRG